MAQRWSIVPSTATNTAPRHDRSARSGAAVRPVTRTGTIKGVASVPTLGEQPPSAATETLDALDDRIAHAGHARPPGRKLSRSGWGTLAESVRRHSTTAMASNRPGAAAPDPLLVPPILAAWLSVFRPCFTAPVWNRVPVLVAGAVLGPGKRTVTQALRVMGLADEPSFRRPAFGQLGCELARNNDPLRGVFRVQSRPL